MADIRLPNGQVVAGVPDDVSQSQLVELLQKNGHDTSWYTPPERSYPERVVKEGLPAVANIGADLLTAIPAGFNAAGVVGLEAIASPISGRGPGEWLDRGADAFHAQMESAQDFQPRFKGPGVQETQQSAMDLLQDTVAIPGAGAEMAAIDPASMGGFESILGRQIMGIQPQDRIPFGASAPGLRTSVEGAANFAPIPGVGLAAKGMRKVFPALDPQTSINAKLKQLEDLQKALDRSRGERMQTGNQPDLFEDTFHPAERSPYQVPEQERAALEAELNDPRTIDYPPEMAIDPSSPQGSLLGGLGGQPEAFALGASPTPRTLPEAPYLGLRGPRQHFNPKVTPSEYTGPRATVGDPSAPNFQPGVPETLTPQERKFRFEGPAKGQAALERRRQNLRSQDMGVPFEEGLYEAAQAADKPGFMRSAEEVMRARKWGKQEGSMSMDMLDDTIKALRETAKQLRALPVPNLKEASRLEENAAKLESQREDPRTPAQQKIDTEVNKHLEAFQRSHKGARGLGDSLPMNKGPKGRQVGAVKMPGGEWHPLANIDWRDELAAHLRGFDIERPARGQVWADKAVTRYLQKYAGTERDPLKDIEIPYRDGYARWEDLTDLLIASRTALKYSPQDPVGKDILAGKIKPESEIWDINRNSSAFGGRLPNGERVSAMEAKQAFDSYMRHVGDYLQQHVRPDQLDRYDFVRAVRETAEWDKRMAKKMEKARAGSAKDLTIHKEYPDGFKWVKLDKPGQFAAESDVMGHSVRGYEPPKFRALRADERLDELPIGDPRRNITRVINEEWDEAANRVPLGVAGHPEYGLGGWEAIKRGDAEIYSLRDPKNNSHVTIEVAPKGRTSSYETSVPDMAPIITQIKGKQNRAPAKEYLKYVQDFVKSQEWGDVGDLHNTGLVQTKQGFKTFTEVKKEVDDLVKRYIPWNDKYRDGRGIPTGRPWRQIDDIVASIKDGRFEASGTHPYPQDLARLYDQLQEFANDSTIFEPSNLIDGGPGTSQRGGPGLSKPTKQASEYEQFARLARAKGIMLPDDVMKAVFDGREPDLPETKSGHPDEHIKKVLNNNPVISKIKNEFNDDRPLTEIKKLLDDPKTKDVDWLDKNVVGKIINGSFVASQHPLISRASSEINRVKDWELTTGNQYMHGKSPKAPDEGTANYWWKQLPPDGREAVRRVGWEINNVNRSLTPDEINSYSEKVNGRPLTGPEMSALQDRTAVMRKVLEEQVNPMRIAEGKEPIRPLPNFFSPAVFDKPFKIIFYDKSGDPIHVESTYLRPNMDKIWENFKGEYDKSQIRLAESKIRTSTDMETFELILRQLDKQSRSQASNAISEGLRKLGFARHGLQRKGASGGKGSGKKQVREYEQVYEEYIREMIRYVGNRKLDQFFNEVNKMDVPNHAKAKTYSLEAIDAARGGSAQAAQQLDKFITGFLNGAIEYGTFGKVGLPDVFWSQFLKLGANIKVPLLIGFLHPIHIGAQLLQHLYMIPAGMRMSADAGFLKQQHAVWTTVFKTYADMVQEISGGGKRAPLVQTLNERGALDATVKFDWVNYASENLKDYRSLLHDHATGVSFLTMLEKQGVRKPAAYFTLNLMEQLGADFSKGLSPEKAIEVKNIISKYMVDNRFHNKSHMFTRSGLTGTALSPLMNFMTTWMGMFREFHRLAQSGYYVKPAAVAPFATFMALNLVLAGVLQLVGTKEYNMMATLSNNLFGTKLPMWEEIVWSKDYMGIQNKAVTHGVLSDATELNIGATFNAPTITGNYAAGLSFWKDLGSVVATMAKGAMGKATVTESRDAIKTMLPRFNILDNLPGTDIPLSWAGAEKLATPDNVPYQSSGETAVYKRDEKDWRARRLGTYSTDEAEYKTKTMVSRDKMAERTKRFQSRMNKMGDRLLLQGKRDVSDLAKEMIQDGYTYDDILNGLVAELRRRLVEPQAQMQGQVRSSRQAQIYQLLKDLEAR